MHIIITEASAKSARDIIAFANPEDIELRLMRLNSISQAVFTSDAKLATVSASVLEIIDGRVLLRDPAAFEEVFAQAKRAHVNRERQDISNDSSNKKCLPQKKSKLKHNTKKATAWRCKFAKITLFAVKAL